MSTHRPFSAILNLATEPALENLPKNDIERALDEADRAAARSDERRTAEEVFGPIKKRIRVQGE